MYNMSEKNRIEFHRNLLSEYFRRYESHMYDNKVVTEKRFVNHYMLKNDYDKQYNKILSDRRTKTIDDKLN